MAARQRRRVEEGLEEEKKRLGLVANIPRNVEERRTERLKFLRERERERGREGSEKYIWWHVASGASWPSSST